MQQQEIHSYLLKYFQANDCEIIENNSGQLTVQLTVDLDKRLMNRPFYWTYIEKTGGIPNPMKLTLLTDFKPNEKVKGEHIHFGSPRLHRIFQSTKELGAFIRLYEERQSSMPQQVALVPWLCLNVKISYICDRKKDQFRSIGLNLIHGVMVENFHDKLLQLPLTPKIPDFSFTLTPIIMPISGIKRIENHIRKEIEEEEHQWAEEAIQRWEKDQQLLDYFYEELDEKPETYFIEKEALREQYEPKINVSIINGGLFYLSKASI